MVDNTNTENDETVTGSLFNTRWEENREATATANYRTVSVLSIVCLVFGFLSVAVTLNWCFIIINAITLILGVITLWQIHRSNGMLFGAALAFIGVFLAVFIVVASFVADRVYWTQICEQAIPCARNFLEAAKREKDILVIEEFKRPYWQHRKIPTIELWKSYEKDEFGLEALGSICNNQFVRTLMALHDKAEISFYRVKNHSYLRGNLQVTLTFAVTYPGESGKETFFADVTLNRTEIENAVKIENQDMKYAGWSVSSCVAPVIPMEFK